MNPEEPITPELLQQAQEKFRLLIALQLFDEIFHLLRQKYPEAYASLLRKLPDFEEKIFANKNFPNFDPAKAAVFFDAYEEQTTAFFSVLLTRLKDKS